MRRTKRSCLVLLAWLVALPAPAAAEGSAGDTVVLLHGLARSDRSMRHLASYLREAGFRAHAIPYESTEKPPDALVADLRGALARCCAEAERLHFVTHSLGGVLLRAVLSQGPLANLGRVVMLAPPNGGSELADVVRRSPPLLAAFGPTAAALGTDPESLPNRLPAADFEVGVIAGTWTVNPLGSLLIPAADDGTVSVASTRLEGMADFLTLPVTHTFILRSREAARQTLAFLTLGRFDPPEEAEERCDPF